MKKEREEGSELYAKIEFAKGKQQLRQAKGEEQMLKQGEKGERKAETR